MTNLKFKKDFFLPTHTIVKTFNKDLSVVALMLIEDHFVFIKRNRNMPTHKGQIGCVGGHLKENENIEEGMRREVKEELSFSFDLKLYGRLKTVLTPTPSTIIPLFCEVPIKIDEFLKVIKSNGEWDDLFLVPIEELQKIEAWEFSFAHANDSKPIFFYSLKAYTYKSFLNSNDRPHVLWGATAKIVLDFLNGLS